MPGTASAPAEKIGSNQEAAAQQGGSEGLEHIRLGETLSAAPVAHRAVTATALTWVSAKAQQKFLSLQRHPGRTAKEDRLCSGRVQGSQCANSR